MRNDNDQKISSKKQENMLVNDLTIRGGMNYNPSIKNEEAVNVPNLTLEGAAFAKKTMMSFLFSVPEQRI